MGKPRPDRALAYSTTTFTYNPGRAGRIDDIGPSPIDGSTVRPVSGRIAKPNPLETSERPVFSNYDTARKDPNDKCTAITQSKPWLDRTRWQQIFEGANYAVLVALIALPSNPPTSLRHLGKGLHPT
ncbi:uncharacterized protein B0I36DRAFT_401267, partial [Microdochium trichocladiopsis]